jgi:PAS domain S-box-containing protein
MHFTESFMSKRDTPQDRIDEPLYNSRLIKNYKEYVKKFRLNVDIDSALKYAGIATYELEDQAHWFSQRQVDRFHHLLSRQTGDPHISRKVGRYSASSQTSGILRKYALGLIRPASAYWMVEKFASNLTRASKFKARKVAQNSIEITVIPEAGINEKPYQCENRMGYLESIAKLFTNKLARVDHRACFHKGSELCRYVITWEQSPYLAWKRIRNFTFLLGLASSLGLLLVLPTFLWFLGGLLVALLAMMLSLYTAHVEKRELTKTIQTQGDAAKELLDEMNVRYNNALFIQEIGQATSTILSLDELIMTMVRVMEKRLDFDRGMIMLAGKDKARLHYAAGYGYGEDREAILRQTQFRLDSLDSKGIFVLAFKEQKPYLFNDLDRNGKDLSKRSAELVREMDVHSLLCVPIVYERESLGILAVDNTKSKRPLTQSDISLLMGVASQTALGIMNARSFQKLKESEKKYRDLIENANSIILRKDIKGRITFFNEFAQRFFGYGADEILGKNVIGTIYRDTSSVRDQHKKLFDALRENPERQVVRETENVLRSGEPAWVTWTYKPIFDEQGQLAEILAIGNDITELKKAEKEKKELEARLVRAQKMEAIGTLAGGVAHDLNNILAGLVSYPELLLMDLPSESPLRGPILTIQKSGEKAAAIVQDLLTLARRGVATTEVVNLNEIVSEYLSSPEYEKLKMFHPNVDLETRLESNLLNTFGSPVHLSKTVMNLVSNAAEAMPNGGKLAIRTENRYIDKPVKGYDEVEEGDYILLEVSDTGIGIALKDIERIFEPFYTKKAMGRSGTGLGMAVVWGTVKDHKGYIDVRSVEGKGTTFSLYFPVTRKDLAKEKAIVSIEDYLGKGESILVVDDVEEQREIASGMLRKLGYDVTTVPSGEEAVEYMKENRSDLMVLDMIMRPGIDGLETYKRIAQMHPGQKAIIVSGFSESDRVKEAQKLGAGGYVKKPYLMEKIGLAVRKELGWKKPTPFSLSKK